MKRSMIQTLLFCGLALAITACGDNYSKPKALPDSGATLEGTVKFGSDDVPFAEIVVVRGTDRATGRVGPDGKYQVVNVPIGEVTIGVDTSAAEGDFREASMRGGAYQGPDGKAAKRVNMKFIRVPEKFADPATSGLKTTVEKGNNTFNIVIKK